MNIRAIGFWIVDILTGCKVLKAYQNLKKIDSLDCESDEFKEYTEKKIFDILKHASKSTEFYLNKGLNLEEFSIINKVIIKENNIISKQYKGKKVFEMSTSGSTGTPFTCYQDLVKKRNVNAEIIFYAEKVNYSIGNKLVFYRAMSKKIKKSKSKLKYYIQNEKIVDINDLSGGKIKKIFDNLENENGAITLAYASTYDAFKDYIIKNKTTLNQNINLRGMISSAEMLYDKTRIIMEETFNCKCVSRYSNQENGIIGQDDDKNNIFYINDANYLVEIFDMKEDKLLKLGEIGRIVVTDYHNKAMPMIRYDTGDIGSIEIIKKNNKNKRVISNFSGRRIDMIYDINNNKVSPYSITNMMWEFQEIRQYQFIQKNKGDYEIKLNVLKNFDKNQELITGFKDLLGKEIKIEIKIVKEIPVLSSGKRKYIINLMEEGK